MKQNKILVNIMLASMVFACGVGYAKEETRPAFSEFAVSLFQGKLRIPLYYRKGADGWRDDLGKLVEAPHVNFAGRYFAAAHSCGANCRYFTLSDLTTGQDSPALNLFDIDESHRAVTNDGRYYITELITRPNSFLLVARYHIESDGTHEAECRERFFTLAPDAEKVLPASRTFSNCTE